MSITSIHFILIPKNTYTDMDRILFQGEECRDGSISIMEPLEYQGKKVRNTDAFILRDLKKQKTGLIDDFTYDVFLTYVLPTLPIRSRVITPIDSFEDFQKKIQESLSYIFKTPHNFSNEDLKYWREDLYRTDRWLQKPKNWIQEIPLQKFIHLRNLFTKILEVFPSSIEEMRSEDSRVAKLRNELQNPI